MKGKATKKPVEINWFEWEGPGSYHELHKWVHSLGDLTTDWFLTDETGVELKVKTLEGSSYEVPAGYIIIRGVEGEYYPCEPQIFDKTYNKT